MDRYTHCPSVRALVTVMLLVAFAFAIPLARAQNTTGQWSAVISLPYIPIHTTLLPNGKVLFYSYYSDSLHPQIWDSATGSVTATAQAPYEIFCSGHTLLPDGRVFITGGHIADYTGYKHAIIYDPFLNSFSNLPDMNAGRWYPTNTVLPNGDVLVLSGDETSNTTPDPLPQVFQFSTNSWRNLTTAQLQMALYPVMFVAPNGKVFNAGPSRTSRYLTTSGTGSWATVATMNYGAVRDYGPGVMYDAGKVMEIGGGAPPTATAEIIDLSASTLAWKYTGSMHYARRQHNAVIMPDGKVFVVGGGNSGTTFDPSANPVYPTELWDPATGVWTVMASISKYRGYHSTAILLPDGRVISAGGNVGGPNLQIFSPPWMVNGSPRPTITSVPSQVGYGQTISIATPDAASIKQVTWIRLPSTTHTFDQNGRFMRLSFTAGSGSLTVTTPANANLSPPGHYMLFIVNGSGVPSVAKIVQIAAGVAPTTGTVVGKVTNTSGAGISGANVSGGSASTTTLSDGTYTLANVTPGTVTLTASATGYQSNTATVSVTAGSTATAPSIQLTATSAGSITGLVVNSSNAAIAGATVSGGGISTTTDSTGHYTLSNVPAGTVTVTASATGYQSASTTVSVTANTTTTAPNITLIPNTGTIAGKVKNTAGTGISGASVGYGGGNTSTDSTGAYTLANVPVGTVQLVASASGYTSQTQNVSVSGGATTTANFTLSAGSTAGTVTGKVTNISTGSAISGATVSWSGGSTTTSTTGTYTLNNVTSGTQNFTATASGYIARTLSASVTGGASNTVNIALATGGKLSISVKNSSGSGVAGASIHITGGVVSTTVDGTTSSGSYLSPWIPIGSYTITVSQTGHTTQSKTATVSTGATTTVSFTNF